MPLDSEDCEEEGMPPPPDNDSRRPVYTFSSGMTPLSFSSTLAPIAPTQDNSPPPSFSSSLLSDSVNLDGESAPSTSMPTASSSSRPHGKRRDPSYIPRPPNAFILFRCAFIKEQNIPGKVEGNHSRLSKIIGLCWKQLPPEEKEKWEAKAVIAQAEHRAHYPDWRFRPGANAMAKLKIKEAGPSSRKRAVRGKASKDKDEGGASVEHVTTDAKGKGKMKASSSHRISLEETRCAKIAGFVAEGIKGEELEEAVKQWEGDHTMPRSSAQKPPATKSKARKPKAAPTHSRTHSTASITLAFPTAPPISDVQEQSTPVSLPESRSPTVDSGTSHPPPQDKENGANSGLAGVPLTQMFKRATSAPAPDSRVPLQSPGSDPPDVSAGEFPPGSAEPSPVVGTTFGTSVLQSAPTRTHNHTHGRRDTVSFPLSTIAETSPINYASSPQLTWQEAESQRRYEEAQHHDSWSWQQTPQAGYSATPHPGQQQPQPQQPPGRIDLSSPGMSYEIPRGGSQFDQGYLEQYGSYYVNEKSEAGQPEWTNMADSGRQGVATTIEDPYEDDCAPGASLTTINVPPPSIPVPLPPGSDYYYTQMSPHHKSQSYASSNFATLRDWSGEYKGQAPLSESPAWPNSVPQSPMSGAWYSNPENIAPWGSQPPLQHSTVAHDAEDWDRIEYRNSSSFNLPVEPMPQVTFHGELLAQQQQRQRMS